MIPENTVDVQAILEKLDELMQLAKAIEKLSHAISSSESEK